MKVTNFFPLSLPSAHSEVDRTVFKDKLAWFSCSRGYSQCDGKRNIRLKYPVCSWNCLIQLKKRLAWFINNHHLCSEVLCLGIVTFEQGVAWPTGSYSMAVRPNEEHPCVLRGKGTQIKYATRVLRALFHAKPNISPVSTIDKVWCHMWQVQPHFQF